VSLYNMMRVYPVVSKSDSPYGDWILRVDSHKR
jgi:hypothetical protein